MVRSKLLISTAVAAIVTFAGASMAADVDPADLCLKADGEMSESALDETFRSIDGDRDGFVSSEEYEACLSSAGGYQVDAGSVKERMAKLDANADERISREEFLSAGSAGSGTEGAAASQSGSVMGSSEGTASKSADAEGESASTPTDVTSSESAEGVQDEGASQAAGSSGPAETTAESGDTSSSMSATEDTQQSDTGAGAQTGTVTAEGSQESDTGTTAESGSSSTAVPGTESTQQSGATSTYGSAGETAEAPDDAGAVEGRAVYSDAELRQLASDLIGKNLVNSNGEDLGEIDDFVIDDEGGGVFAIASIGGFLGIGEKDIAVPFEDLEIRDDDVVMTTPMTAEELEGMPSYEEGTWRSLNVN